MDAIMHKEISAVTFKKSGKSSNSLKETLKENFHIQMVSRLKYKSDTVQGHEKYMFCSQGLQFRSLFINCILVWTRLSFPLQMNKVIMF